MEILEKEITVFIDGTPKFRVTVTKDTTIGQIKKLFPKMVYEDMKMEAYKGKEVPGVLKSSKYDKTNLSSVFDRMKDAKIYLETKKKALEKSEGVQYFPTGVKDVDMLILSRIEDDRDLLNTLNSNTVTRKYADNEDLWRNRFMQRFPEDFDYVKNMKSDWKTFYLALISYLEQSRGNYHKALELAAKKGNRDLVDYFIFKGAHNWNRALKSAAEGGHRDLVVFFIEKGADRIEDFGLVGATLGGHFDLVKYFIFKGAHNWNRALEAAAEGGHRHLVDFFIKKGANQWISAAQGAAEGGHGDLVKFFTKQEQKRDRNYKENFALPGAAQGGHEDLVHLYVNQKGGYKRWIIPLQSAAESGNQNLVDFFIEKIDEKEKNVLANNSGLSGAAKGGHWNLVKFFINKGATDWNGAMLNAVKGGHRDLINFFIEKGANRWRDASHFARIEGYDDLVEFFQNKI